jgi:hypothetical protein
MAKVAAGLLEGNKAYATHITSRMHVHCTIPDGHQWKCIQRWAEQPHAGRQVHRSLTISMTDIHLLPSHAPATKHSGWGKHEGVHCIQLGPHVGWQ